MSSNQDVFGSPKFSCRYVIIACSFDAGARTAGVEPANQTMPTTTTHKIRKVSVCFFISNVMRQALQQGIGFAEPGSLTAAQITRHGRLLGENALRPFTRFSSPMLFGEKARVVVISLGKCGFLSNFLKEAFSLRGFPCVGIGMGQQTGRSIRIVLSVL